MITVITFILVAHVARLIAVEFWEKKIKKFEHNFEVASVWLPSRNFNLSKQ